jgi:hypothetical protein
MGPAHRPVSRQEGAPDRWIQEKEVLELVYVHQARVEEPAQRPKVIALVLVIEDLQQTSRNFIFHYWMLTIDASCSQGLGLRLAFMKALHKYQCCLNTFDSLRQGGRLTSRFLYPEKIEVGGGLMSLSCTKTVTDAVLFSD